MMRCRVGKIACRNVAAWARRARDPGSEAGTCFAHADARMSAPLPTLQFRADEVIE
jgi:hypothetical protein